MRQLVFVNLIFGSRRRVLCVAFACVAVTACVGVFAATNGTFAAFTGGTTNSGNAISSGTVGITNNSGGVALLSFSNIQPNAAQPDRCIKVTATGNVASAVRFYSTTTGTGLDSYLALRITRGTYSGTEPGYGSCTNFAADSTTYVTGQPAGVVFADSMSNLPTTYASAIADPNTSWSQNEAHVYRFQAVLGPNRSAEGKNTTESFTWEARG